MRCPSILLASIFACCQTTFTAAIDVNNQTTTLTVLYTRANAALKKLVSQSWKKWIWEKNVQVNRGIKLRGLQANMVGWQKSAIKQENNFPWKPIPGEVKSPAKKKKSHVEVTLRNESRWQSALIRKCWDVIREAKAIRGKYMPGRAMGNKAFVCLQK